MDETNKPIQPAETPSIPTAEKSQTSHGKLITTTLVVFLMAFAVAAGLIYWYEKNPNPKLTGNPESQDKATTNSPFDPRIKIRQSMYQLTKEEFDSEREYYTNLVVTQNPKIALTELRANVQADTALLRSCHALTHEIGRFSYTKYQSFGETMNYLDEICNTGYMHGVIEELFYDSKDIMRDMASICEGSDEGRCHHGVGHGLMFYTNNNLPESLRLCETYPKTSVQQYCAEGVFMENFNLDQKDHVSEFLSSTDLFYPCAEQKSRYKDVCYYYAPLQYLSKNPNQYEQALDWCNTAETNRVVRCIRGVAAVMIKQNISAPKTVESYCMTTDPKHIPYCIDGMVGLYINHHNSPQKGYELCETLLESNRRTCIAGVSSRESQFSGQVESVYIMTE